ncbi:hypothetical protein EMCRGX_G018408 [Ephydatia muelleri]
MSKRLITVFGATGQQGGPVARALLSSGFAVRAVTRNPDSEKSLSLKQAGAELVKGDLENRSTIDEAVKGAYGVFLVTDYWGILHRLGDDNRAEAEEIAQGKAVVDASARAGVKHVVYSGLPGAKDVIGHRVPHLDGKAVVEKYLGEAGVPYTSVHYPAYYDNFGSYFKAQPQPDGTYAITLPMNGPMYTIAVDDGGPVVASVFSNPGEFLGKKIGIAGDRKTVDEYAAIISKSDWKDGQLYSNSQLATVTIEDDLTTDEITDFTKNQFDPARYKVRERFQFYSCRSEDTVQAFEIFDENVRRCFVQCTAVETSDHAWHQTRLSLSRGGLEGLGLHPNSRLPKIGGLVLRFHMVLAAHCALRLLLTHLAIMLLPAREVLMWYNKLRDDLAESCRLAHLGVQMEMGSNVTSNHNHAQLFS